MKEYDFKLKHDKERLFAEVTIRGHVYEMDVTSYFDENNPHDDWLDYRLGLRDLVESSKFKKN